ncbi:hypothetical protein [Algoriphagus resistens]|uniref:hypothetical protein n=1 Tax=Algoriphagus resistens TaxID=1750590 RepID=UPI0007168F93|nr:hypothetical protein [Algoriphagus resistens]
MLHLLDKQRAHRPRVNADINNTDIKYHHVTTLIEVSEYHKMYPLGTADLVKPKFKEGIKINLHRALEGEPLFGTVSRSTTGK